MLSTLLQDSVSAKEKQQIRCCHCASTMVIRNGTYPRFDPVKNKLIRVQRFLCKVITCPWRTFSVLPVMILPVVRHTLDSILAFHQWYNVQEMSPAAVARKMQLSRGTVKRLGVFCRLFMPWLEHERKIAVWGSALNHFWMAFIRDFSQKFYPERWQIIPSTQIKPFD